MEEDICKDRDFDEVYYYCGSLYYLSRLLEKYSFQRERYKWRVKNLEIDDYLVEGHISVSRLKNEGGFRLLIKVHATATEDWTPSWDDVFEEYTDGLMDTIRYAEEETDRRDSVGDSPALSNDEMWELFKTKSTEGKRARATSNKKAELIDDETWELPQVLDDETWELPNITDIDNEI